MRLIDAEPTIDAVEVVRCKNCIYAENDYEEITYKCKFKSIYKFAEDFCSEGIRKENE